MITPVPRIDITTGYNIMHWMRYQVCRFVWFEGIVVHLPLQSFGNGNDIENGSS